MGIKAYCRRAIKIFGRPMAEKNIVSVKQDRYNNLVY